MAYDGAGFTGDTKERRSGSGKAEVAAAVEKTPFDLGAHKARECYVPHLGCLTLRGQLTNDEEKYIAGMVQAWATARADCVKVTDRTATTTTVAIATPGVAIGICMTNDGKKVMVCEPVRTQPFGKGPTKTIVDALHAWRHKHGSEESNKIVGAIKKMVSGARAKAVA